MLGLTQQKTLINSILCSFIEGMKVRSSNTELSYLQVFSEILYVCTEPQTKVQILCKTGLTLRRLDFCLKYLLKQNVVKLHHRKRTYITTEEGLRIRRQLPQD